jgi:apolipoprotein N-acyltransferase
MHARVTPVRAAEYRVPIFRLASSGISQWVDRNGTVLAKTSFPGQGSILHGELYMREPGSLPLDRFLAPFSVMVTITVIGWLLLAQLKHRRARTNSNFPQAKDRLPAVQNAAKP